VCAMSVEDFAKVVLAGFIDLRAPKSPGLFARAHLIRIILDINI
jgi:hypothetical protein